MSGFYLLIHLYFTVRIYCNLVFSLLVQKFCQKALNLTSAINIKQICRFGSGNCILSVWFKPLCKFRGLLSFVCKCFAQSVLIEKREYNFNLFRTDLYDLYCWPSIMPRADFWTLSILNLSSLVRPGCHTPTANSKRLSNLFDVHIN